MLHPTTILFASYNIKTSKFENINISFLNERDINIINAEISKMAMILSEDNIFYENFDRISLASTTQYTLTGQITISRETAIVLTKLAEACSFWNKNNTAQLDEGKSDDLSSDMLLTKIDAFPSSIYRIVYNLLSEDKYTSSRQNKGLLKLNEVLQKIIAYNNQGQSHITGEMLNKINNLSSMHFWRLLLSKEYMKYYSELPPKITLDTMQTIKNELAHFNIHGFVPPDKVYQAFNSVTEYRKSTIHVSEEIIEFLFKIVKSGGISL